MSLKPDERLRDPGFRALAYGWCIDYLDAAIVLLSTLTPTLIGRNWSPETLGDLRALVEDWGNDLEEDGTFTKRQHRTMTRWFVDAGLDFPAVSLLLASVDNIVHDALEMGGAP
jgi:hypothetical protein